MSKTKVEKQAARIAELEQELTHRDQAKSNLFERIQYFEKANVHLSTRYEQAAKTSAAYQQEHINQHKVQQSIALGMAAERAELVSRLVRLDMRGKAMGFDLRKLASSDD